MAFTFTDANVREIIAQGGPVVIDFWATWCMALAPVVESLATEFEGRAIIGKYNVDEESEFGAENRIRSIPTILFYKNGAITPIRLVGSQSVETLRAKIEELIAL